MITEKDTKMIEQIPSKVEYIFKYVIKMRASLPLVLILFLRNSTDEINSLLSSESDSSSFSSCFSSSSTGGANVPKPSLSGGMEAVYKRSC